MSSTDAANIRGQLRRADKVMSTAEIDHVLRTRFCGRTATVGSDGYPYVVPNLIYGTEALFGCTQERRTVTSRATQATMTACASKWTSREKCFLTVISSAIPRFRFVRSSFLDASASSGMRPRPGFFHALYAQIRSCRLLGTGEGVVPAPRGDQRLQDCAGISDREGRRVARGGGSLASQEQDLVAAVAWQAYVMRADSCAASCSSEAFHGKRALPKVGRDATSSLAHRKSSAIATMIE